MTNKKKQEQNRIIIEPNYVQTNQDRKNSIDTHLDILFLTLKALLFFLCSCLVIIFIISFFSYCFGLVIFFLILFIAVQLCTSWHGIKQSIVRKPLLFVMADYDDDDDHNKIKQKVC